MTFTALRNYAPCEKSAVEPHPRRGFLPMRSSPRFGLLGVESSHLTLVVSEPPLARPAVLAYRGPKGRSAPVSHAVRDRRPATRGFHGTVAIGPISSAAGGPPPGTCWTSSWKELEDRDRSTRSSGALAVGHAWGEEAIRNCPKAPQLRLVLNWLGLEWLRFKEHVRIRQGIPIPKWVAGKAPFGGNDRYPLTVVEVEDTAAMPVAVARVARIDDSGGASGAGGRSGRRSTASRSA